MPHLSIHALNIRRNSSCSMSRITNRQQRLGAQVWQQGCAGGFPGISPGRQVQPGLHPSQPVNHGTQFAQGQGCAEAYRNIYEFFLLKRMSASRKANLHFCAQS